MLKSYKCYNKQITNRGNSNVQFHDQEENKLNSNINANSSPHTLTYDKIKKNQFDKNNLFGRP